MLGGDAQTLSGGPGCRRSNVETMGWYLFEKVTARLYLSPTVLLLTLRSQLGADHVWSCRPSALMSPDSLDTVFVRPLSNVIPGSIHLIPINRYSIYPCHFWHRIQPHHTVQFFPNSAVITASDWLRQK